MYYTNYDYDICSEILKGHLVLATTHSYKKVL